MTKLCKQRLQEFNTAGQASKIKRAAHHRHGQALRLGRARPELRASRSRRPSSRSRVRPSPQSSRRQRGLATTAPFRVMASALQACQRASIPPWLSLPPRLYLDDPGSATTRRAFAPRLAGGVRGGRCRRRAGALRRRRTSARSSIASRRWRRRAGARRGPDRRGRGRGRSREPSRRAAAPTASTSAATSQLVRELRERLKGERALGVGGDPHAGTMP